MTVELVKGQNVVLDKDGGLNKVIVGLGWDIAKGSGSAFDLDASAFMLREDGKVVNDNGFVFFNNLKSACGSVCHQGDNLTGEGDGDDEQIVVELSKVPAEVAKIVFAVTIFKAGERKQNFGMVANAFIRICNAENGEEILKFDLSEDACTDKSLNFGELYRKDGAWKFRALGQGFAGEIGELAKSYGVNL